MGYNTDFLGAFDFKTPVSEEVRDYINTFSSTRHCIRDNDKIKNLISDWQEKTYPLNKGNLGKNGEFFVFDHINSSKYDFDFDYKNLVIDYNDCGEMPELWCQWIISDDCQHLEWDGGEKFYEYTEWLNYLIDNFFKPYNIILNGEVKFRGEEFDDIGQITIIDNEVSQTYYL